jgi:predicted nucleic acid-binding protein
VARLILDTSVLVAGARGLLDESDLAGDDDIALPAVAVAEYLAGALLDCDPPSSGEFPSSRRGSGSGQLPDVQLLSERPEWLSVPRRGRVPSGCVTRGLHQPASRRVAVDRLLRRGAHRAGTATPRAARRGPRAVGEARGAGRRSRWPDRLVIALEQSLFGGADRAGYTNEADVSLPTASSDLRRLLDAGFLVQRGRTRSTRYVASGDLRGLVDHALRD